jgi:hypothetical protein
LRDANLNSTNLAGANLDAANLTKANVESATLTNANLQGADLASALFQNSNFTNANLSYANLTNAHVADAVFDSADLSFADTRCAHDLDTTGAANLRNTILPDGAVNSLNLAAGETLLAYARIGIPLQVPSDFSIDAAARLDLTDNAMVVDYNGDSPVEVVREKILSARGKSGIGGTWSGPGITSSTASAANEAAPDSRSIGYAENETLPLGRFGTFNGVHVDRTSVLIAYTRTGDANLDGVVDDDDVTIVSATYAPGVRQPHWALGDFDYNGFVDDDDITLLGAFYDPTPGPLLVPVADSNGIVAVPEPSSVAFAIFAACAGAVGFAAWRCNARRAVKNFFARCLQPTRAAG